jgi:hypothetical protein
MTHDLHYEYEFLGMELKDRIDNLFCCSFIEINIPHRCASGQAVFSGARVMVGNSVIRSAQSPSRRFTH